jgi:hypothetical protein
VIENLKGFPISTGSKSHYGFVLNLALSRRIGTLFNQDLIVLKCHSGLENVR